MPVFRCPGGISNGDLHGETMKTILSILLWIWQAPQNIVGLALRLWYRGRVAVVLLYDHHCGGVSYRVVPDLPGGGISLGATVLVRYWFIDAPELYAHEYGHVKQISFGCHTIFYPPISSCRYNCTGLNSPSHADDSGACCCL